MLNSVRKIPFRNTASMCKRSFAEMVGDDAYVADLSSNRRVTVKNFNGTVLINIRQYYQKDDNGPIMASKKGIALTLQQWEKMMIVAPEITAAARELAKDLPEQPKSEGPFNPKPFQPNNNQNSLQGSYKYNNNYQNKNYYQNNGQQQQQQTQAPPQAQVPPVDQAANTFKGTF